MDDRLVNLEIFERSSEAKVLASKLRAYGIFAHVGGPTAALPQWRSIQMGGIPVKVRVKDYETAKAIMEDVLPAVSKPSGPIARNASAIGVLLCAGAMLALIVRARVGATNEDLAGVFFVLSTAYIVPVGEAIRSRRQWWTLLTLPIAVRFAIDLFTLWNALRCLFDPSPMTGAFPLAIVSSDCRLRASARRSSLDTAGIAGKIGLRT